jgi:hypothetical protein
MNGRINKCRINLGLMNFELTLIREDDLEQKQIYLAILKISFTLYKSAKLILCPKRKKIIDRVINKETTIKTALDDQ